MTETNETLLKQGLAILNGGFPPAPTTLPNGHTVGWALDSLLTERTQLALVYRISNAAASVRVMGYFLRDTDARTLGWLVDQLRRDCEKLLIGPSPAPDSGTPQTPA